MTDSVIAPVPAKVKTHRKLRFWMFATTNKVVTSHSKTDLRVQLASYDKNTIVGAKIYLLEVKYFTHAELTASLLNAGLLAASKFTILSEYPA